jgi:hypothetical protein
VRSAAVPAANRRPHRLLTEPAAAAAVTRDLAERRVAHDLAGRSDRRAVHAGAADHPHAPAPVGAGAQHRESVVAQQQVGGQSQGPEGTRDAAIVDWQVGAADAHDGDPRQRPQQRIDGGLAASARDGVEQGLDRPRFAAGRERRAGAARRAEHDAVGAHQGDVDLGVAAVDGENVGPCLVHGSSSIVTNCAPAARRSSMISGSAPMVASGQL